VNARHSEQSEWRAFSAGTRPTGYVHPLAVRALEEIGIPHAGTSKSIDDLPMRDFDLVVTVCDSAAEECPVWPGRAARRMHHGFRDPAKAEGTETEKMKVFREVRDEMLSDIPGMLNK
ncbi:MAG TPA: arsenate reductase ArsC, partial [Anaerolineales bacterium]